MHKQSFTASMVEKRRTPIFTDEDYACDIRRRVYVDEAERYMERPTGSTPIIGDQLFRRNLRAAGPCQHYVMYWLGAGQLYSVSRVAHDDLPTHPLARDELPPGEILEEYEVPYCSYYRLEKAVRTEGNALDITEAATPIP